jgi:hypothetical protein
VRRAAGLHPELYRERQREAFCSLFEAAWVSAPAERIAERQAFIDSLPVVEWKGETLRTLRCQGRTGRGPHDQHVPEGLLWSLMDPHRWLCPFHAHEGVDSL